MGHRCVHLCEHVLPSAINYRPQVTIDPGLGRRMGTRWARTLTTYKIHDNNVGDAIPTFDEASEEAGNKFLCS